MNYFAQILSKLDPDLRNVMQNDEWEMYRNRTS